MKRALLYPMVTEKTSQMQATGQYVFAVDCDANKIQIRSEVEALKADIKVEEVRVINVRGKMKRVGRSMGKRPNWKKAVVRLKAGQSLELFESV